MEINSNKGKEASFEFYVSAFCAFPRPSRYEEMSLIKKLIDEDKIPLLKTVVVKVAQVSDTRTRSPVFQKLAEKFGVYPNNPEEEVKPKIEISITEQEIPVSQKGLKSDIATNNVLHEFPLGNEVKSNIVKNLVDLDLVSSSPKSIIHEDAFCMSVMPSSHASVHPGHSSFIHHVKVAQYIKSEYEQELPVALVKLEGDGQSSMTRDPLIIDNNTSAPNSCFVSSWKLSPPTSPEISSPSIIATKSSSQASIYARKPLLPPSPYSSTHVTDTDPNQMLLVDPATSVPVHENSITPSQRCKSIVTEDDLLSGMVNGEECRLAGSLAGSLGQPQEKSFKMKHRGTEHWIVRNPSCPKQSDTQFSCEVCLKSFDTESDVSNHKRQVHKLDKTLVNTVIAKDRLKTVITSVKSVLFACAQCERKCKSKKSLEKHIGRAHNVKSTVPCPENCGKMLTSRAAIKKHLLSHRPPSEWPVSCPLCHKRFQARADIPKHLLTAKHRDENLPEVGSAGWWALVCWDRPELIPTMGRKRKQGR